VFSCSFIDASPKNCPYPLGVGFSFELQGGFNALFFYSQKD